MKRIDCFVCLASQAEILSREPEVASVHVIDEPLTRSAAVRAVAAEAAAAARTVALRVSGASRTWTEAASGSRERISA